MTEDNLSDLIALFGFKKKHELTQHCRQVFLQTDLTRLIQAAKSGQLPWQYLSHHRNLVPEQLSLTEKDLAAIATSGVGHLQPAAQKAVNKIDTIFNQRRLLSGHMFFNANLSDWHFFYFDQRDFATGSNRWKKGPHIHFLNKLWPNQTAQGVWKEFCSSPKPRIHAALHIRFRRNGRQARPA